MSGPTPMDKMSDEDLAASWGAVAGDLGGDEVDQSMADDWGAAGGEMGAGQAKQILNQDEIDSLLGVGASASEAEGRSCIERIIEFGLISHERLPMLEIVFDRLIRILSTSLRNFTGENVEITVTSIGSLRFGEYLDAIPLPCMLSVFNAREWENQGLILVDSSMIYSIVDVLLGGRSGTVPMKVDGRPYTTIERSLVERLIKLVLDDLTVSFQPLAPVNFQFERLETNPRFAMISRSSNATILVKLDVEIDDRRGRIEILLPYATLEPVRELLLQQFIGEKFGRDLIWETHLSEQLRWTDIELDGILAEETMKLSDVVNLSVGDDLVLNCKAGSHVELRCGPVPLFSGRVGRSKNRVAVKIDERYDSFTEGTTWKER